MAFQVPNHLPRQAFTGHGQSLSSSSKHYDDVIVKVGEASWEKLDSSLASSWVHELTVAIDSTQSSIRSKIRANLPDFERQLSGSKDIVARVDSLATDADNLTVALYNQQYGLLPTVTRRLAKQADLTQRAQDAAILSNATNHAVECRDALEELSELVRDARLAETVPVSNKLNGLIRTAPEPLPRANIFVEIKNRFRVLRDSAQEQLADAYARAVNVQSLDIGEQLLILPSVSIPHAQHTITLQEIIDSLNPDSATQRITSFRKVLLSKFIEPAISSRGKVSVNGSAVLLELGQFSSDPIEDLNTLMEFLKEHLFVSLPSQYYSQLVGVLIPQVQSCLLDHLKRMIPSLITELPLYISLAERAVTFEETIVQTDAIRSISLARPISDWVANLSSHYEKKRRELVLRDVRNILSDESHLGGLRVEEPSVGSKVAAATRRDSQSDVVGNTPITKQPTANSTATPSTVEAVDEEDGWGFDDLDGEEETGAKGVVEPTVDSSSRDATTTEEADPWDDDPWDDPTENEPAAAQTTVPKSAKGLEKFSSKSKASSLVSAPPTNGSVHSMNGSGPLSPSLSNLSSPIASFPVATSDFHGSQTPKIKETFLVSECAHAVLQTLRTVVQEGQELAQSKLFSPAAGDAPRPIGSLIMTSIVSVLDLFRALVPVVQAEMMTLSPALRIRFANDCAYLAADVLELASTIHDNEVLSAKVVDASERLGTIGEQWFDDCLERQKKEVLTILKRTKGFVGTGDDAQYAIDQSIADHAVETISTFAQDWRGTLTASAYLDACGFIVEEAISFVLNDILSLPDIPELESHRLNLLCQRLDALKSLFILEPGKETLVGAYVPSWFKFAYLAELLEASLADITYLFESGALIDFESEELVQLLEGLFSDTALRAKTIQKIRTEIPGGTQL